MTLKHIIYCRKCRRESEVITNDEGLIANMLCPECVSPNEGDNNG